ncbi:MAG: type II secretion system protein GspN, partial [Thermodesulfobacteriota bacterium]
MKRRLFIIPLAIAVGLIFFVEALFILVPTRLVEEALKREVHERSGLVMSAKSFQRVFPLGYEARGVRLKNTKWSRELYLTWIRARFSPMSLLRLRPGVVLTGEIYGGALTGLAARGMGADYALINLRQAVLPPIPAPVGIEAGPAVIAIDITAQRNRACPEGSIKARARGGRLKAFSIMGLSLPEGKLSEEGLNIKLAKCRAYVKSAWIKGDAFEVSASGVF